MTQAELEVGLAFTDVGINLPSHFYGPNVKVKCPQCHHTHSSGHFSQRDLSVNIIDGTWKCHRCDYQGSLQKEARERGLERDMVSTSVRSRTRARSTEFEATGIATLPSDTLEDWAIEWLRDQRSISEEAAREFGLTSTTRTMKDGTVRQTIHFPYYIGKALMNVKSRTMPKEFRQTPGAERTLFNLNSILDGSKIIVVTEGELDAIACWMAGWKNVVSPPDGAPGEKYDHTFKPPRPTGIVAEVGNKDRAFKSPEAMAAFADAERIVIATDGDLEGNKLAEHLIEMFGPLKCWRVNWRKYGVKDANELLIRSGASALDLALGSAQPAPLPGIRSLSYQRSAVHKLFDEGFSPGVSSGWIEFDHYFRPELGKLIPVSGYPGRGKTSFLNHLLVNLARENDWRVALYSPEMGEEGEVLGKFVQIVADAPYLPTAQTRISREILDRSIDWVGDHFYEVYAEGVNGQGFQALTVPKILATVDPGVVKYGTNVLVIDPWNQCESARPKGSTVEEYVGMSLATISQWAKRRKVLVFVVVHPRKPMSSKMMDTNPSPMEAAGAAHWYNMADVFLTINRNLFGDDKNITTVEVAKHRKEGITGELGQCRFRFDRATGRFRFVDAIEAPPIGFNPYIDIPNDMRLIPQPMATLPLEESHVDPETPW